jgi:hypothetical protein
LETISDSTRILQISTDLKTVREPNIRKTKHARYQPHPTSHHHNTISSPPPTTTTSAPPATTTTPSNLTTAVPRPTQTCNQQEDEDTKVKNNAKPPQKSDYHWICA